MDSSIIAQMRQTFQKNFGDTEEARLFFAPGRVNLIGEYTDFNGGHVFPCALENGTYALIKPRDDDKIRFYSMNLQKPVLRSDLKYALGYDKFMSWANYPMGMIWAFKEKGYYLPCGFDMVVWGNIPVGSGLSSSASIEVLTGYAFKQLFGFDISLEDIALAGQLDENKYIGVNCGIMDQFVIAKGKKDHAIFLDTATLDYKEVPVHLVNEELIIMNTNHRRGLHDSKYNERRAECEAALADLQKVVSIKNLCDLNAEQFEQYSSAIEDPVCRKRAKHAIYENDRTLKAAQVLQQDDIASFGELMNQSHISLRDDFEVTGPQLDALVEAAWAQPGVLGARMTGAGFGGCGVAIVKKENVEAFKKGVEREYEGKIGYKPSFYDAKIGDGPQEITQ